MKILGVYAVGLPNGQAEMVVFATVAAATLEEAAALAKGLRAPEGLIAGVPHVEPLETLNLADLQRLAAVLQIQLSVNAIMQSRPPSPIVDPHRRH